MFFSPSNCGFYAPEVHGPRTILVPDPAWQRPLVDVRLRPGESYGDVLNDGTEDLLLVQVPDLEAEHPTIEVANPGCKIPADAIEITHEQYADLLNGQAQGGVIGVGAQGRPQLTMPNAPTLAERQAACWNRIKAERDRRTQEGGYRVGEHWFHSDTFSRTQQMGLVMLGAALPSGVQWKTMSGVMVPMTVALAQQIFNAATLSDITTFHAAEAHRVAMEASGEPEAYDFTSGWPPVYGE